MEQILCPQCNTLNLSSNAFCTNCGKVLKVAPFNVSIGKQIGLYLLSFLLPPLGLFPGIKYLRKSESEAKKIGTILIILTIISSIIQIYFGILVLKNINSVFTSQTGESVLPSGL